jgi:hypothetical protein
MSETPQETLEKWLAHPYGRFRVEIREAIRAVLAQLRDVDECRVAMLAFHANQPGLSLAENQSNLIANLNALADERQIAEAERDTLLKRVADLEAWRNG